MWAQSINVIQTDVMLLMHVASRAENSKNLTKFWSSVYVNYEHDYFVRRQQCRIYTSSFEDDNHVFTCRRVALAVSSLVRTAASRPVDQFQTYSPEGGTTLLDFFVVCSRRKLHIGGEVWCLRLPCFSNCSLRQIGLAPVGFWIHVDVKFYDCIGLRNSLSGLVASYSLFRRFTDTNV